MGEKVENLPGIFDQITYDRLAQNLLAGNGYSIDLDWWPATRAGEPTAHWSYLMTLFLYGIYALFGHHPLAARLIQAVTAGILTPWFTFRLGERLGNRTVGLISAAISAVYIYFFYYAGALMTETFFILAVLWMLNASFDFAQEPNWVNAVWLGLALGCGILLRQLLLLFIPFLIFWLLWVNWKTINLRNYLLILVIPALMIIPFTIRNYLAFDQFILLNTNSGYAFFWGNHPIHGTEFISADETIDYQSLIPENLLSLDEAELGSELLSLGLGFVADDPVRYIKLSLSRISDYFRFWPSERSGLISNVSRVFSFGVMLPFMIYGLALTIKREIVGGVNSFFSSPHFLLYMFIIIYTGIHLLTWAMIRYRLPVDAVMTYFAGIAIFELARRFKGNSTKLSLG